jgi:hypothetical protein
MLCSATQERHNFGIVLPAGRHISWEELWLWKRRHSSLLGEERFHKHRQKRLDQRPQLAREVRK